MGISLQPPADKMREWSQKHIFPHCWEIMAQSALRKYPNPHNPNVYSLDVLQRRIRRKEITMCRLFSTLWNVPAIVLQFNLYENQTITSQQPRIIQLSMVTERIVGINKATLVKELVHVDLERKSYTLRAKNITFSNMVEVDETLVYTQCPDDPTKTELNQSATITVKNIPFLSGTLEDLMYSSYSGNASKGRLAIEEVAQKIESEQT